PRAVPPAGPHGGDARSVARALGIDPAGVLDLSASCNPFAADPAPVVAAALAGGALGRYPDEDDRRTATGAMAAALGVDADRVLLTNGGAEAIALVAAVLGRGWVDRPDFSLYERHLAEVVPGAPRFASDPHNPTGRLAPLGATAAVWDEAFYPLATGCWTAGRPGAVVVGSLTKVLACPGLRLGYVVVPDDDGAALGVPELAGCLATRQPRWAVGTPALVALPTLLARADVPGWAVAVARQRDRLCAVLRRHGLDPATSDANFVLVPAAAGLRERLAVHGVVVRDCASFGLAGAVRVAVPDDAGLDRLDRALGASR
ncbi:MAG: aminotransferase class I/II-fold pyridoxal phosphate-dependent enzyme, partial [Acidimicrobiales bacterium]